MNFDRLLSASSRVGIGLAGTLVALVATSCGSSPEDAKRDAAVQRMMNRPKPGYVRVLNLTTRSADVLDKDRPLSATVESGQATRFFPMRAGDVEVTVKFADKSVPVKVKVETGAGSTIVMFPDEKTEIVQNEPIKPLGDANVRVVFLAQAGKQLGASVRAKASSGGSSLELSPDKADVTMSAGPWTVGGPGITGSANMTVESSMAYTVLLIAGNGGIQPFFLLNTNNDKPVTGGVS